MSTKMSTVKTMNNATINGLGKAAAPCCEWEPEPREPSLGLRNTFVPRGPRPGVLSAEVAHLESIEPLRLDHGAPAECGEDRRPDA